MFVESYNIFLLHIVVVGENIKSVIILLFTNLIQHYEAQTPSACCSLSWMLALLHLPTPFKWPTTRLENISSSKLAVNFRNLKLHKILAYVVLCEQAKFAFSVAS